MSVVDLGAPVPTPLPAAPSPDFMSQDQWDVLYALLDGFMPATTAASDPASGDGTTSIVVSDDEYEKILDGVYKTLLDPPPREKLKEFLGLRVVDDPKFRDDVLRSLEIVPQRGQLAKIMSIMSGNVGSMLLTGYWTPVSQQSTKVRQEIVKGWATGRLPALRMLAKSLAAMASKSASISSPYFEEFSGYSDTPRDWKVVEGYDYNFVQAPAGDGTHELTTDVVIVGSGCGGGVSAKNIAEAGHKVMVVDKGYYFPPSHFPMTQSAACQYLYDAGGVAFTDTSSLGIASGSTWGGGGTVNWSVCFRLQDYVREEWADRGLPLFTSTDFDDCMDRVWDFIGASSDAIRHNHRNQAMLDAVKILGWKGGAVDQNTASKEHYCGQCHLGCGSGEKQGPAVSWLPAAGEAGAEFMEGFEAKKIVFGADGVTAVGVEGLWTSRDESGGLDSPISKRIQRRVFIKAKKVIISGGTLWSPVLLAKSGVQNKQVGQNLYLHPASFVSAIYDKEDARPWEGGIITSYVSEFENLDGKGHGVKLEPSCNLPYVTFAIQSWRNGLDSKLLALKYRHLASILCLNRDRDTGRVYPDPKTGKPRIDYTPSDFDREHSIEGLIAIAKIFYVTGASEIRASLAGLESFEPSPKKQAAFTAGKDPEFTDADFAAWIKDLRKADNKPPVSVFLSAHQMGTCRMSAREADGVVNMKGKVWGHKNLYVADASVFPSASGVNPMVTAMSIADWISRGVAKELDQQ